MRYLLFLIIFSLTCVSAFADEIDDLTAKLKAIAEEPFSRYSAAGTPEEYKAFSQQQGNALIETADKMLALPNLLPKDKRFALLMKYWGLTRKFGFNRDEHTRQLEEFVKAVENVSEMTDLYRRIMETLWGRTRLFSYEIDAPQEKAEAFIQWRDRFIPFMTKYCAETDPYQLTYITGQVMESCDPDGSFGLVESTVEMMMPLLKAQEKSREMQSHSNMVQGMGRRVRLTGNDMKYEGVSTEGQLIDVTNYRGKVVFLNFGCRDDRMVEIHKKLFNALHNQGLVIITHDVNNSREVARKKAEDAGIPWIITVRGACDEKGLEDYYQNWGLTNALFLVDREGKLIHSWARGFCPAACDALIKLFPEQEASLSEISTDLIQREKEQREKMAKWTKENESENPLANELDNLHVAFVDAIGYRGEKTLQDVLTPKIVATAKRDLADVQLKTPGITRNHRLAALDAKFESLASMALQRIEEHPEVSPEEAFREVDNLLDEFEQSPGLEEARGIFSRYRERRLWQLLEYLHDHASDKLDFARSAQKCWNAYIKQEIATHQQLSQEAQAQNAARLLRNVSNTKLLTNAITRIYEAGSQELVVSFCGEFASLLDESDMKELQDQAKRFREIAGTIVRQQSSIGKELEFECVLLNGEKVNVKDLRGKIVLVNFWATWCGPCLMEFPNMKTQYEKFKDKGYEMIALSTDDKVEKVVEFQNKNQFPWLIGSLELSKNAGLTDYRDYYGIQGIPETFLLDREGKVLFRMTGINDEQLNAELEKAFGK